MRAIAVMGVESCVLRVFLLRMRDGAKLNATIFASHGEKEPQPVIFTFTPYIGDSYTDRALYFATHGDVLALVDVRGRGNSGGGFGPFANRTRAGCGVRGGVARQRYCIDKVAMRVRPY